jgi:hypothetical protein
VNEQDFSSHVFCSAEGMTCSAGSLTDPDFCLIFAPLKATMNQKSSLPQSAKSVSEVLTPDRAHAMGMMIIRPR